MGQFFVSIIIPVYQDWLRLGKCLKALEQQSYGQENFEILIINNGSKEDCPSDIFIPKNGRILIESGVGSYKARNTGIKNSKGNILGFTDADCIPDRDWIKNALSILHADHHIKRVGGEINLFFKGREPNIFELYEKVYAFKQREKCEQGFSVTANLFTYKYLFNEVGNFNEKLLSGGDWEWGQRAEKLHFKIVFSKYVIVSHPARNKLSELVSKTKRVTGGQLRAVRQAGFIPKIKKIKYLNYYGTGIPVYKKTLIIFIRIYLKVIAIKEVIFIILLGKKENRQ